MELTELERLGDGRICTREDRSTVFHLQRRRSAHFFRYGNGYPITEPVLRACSGQGVEAILIEEADGTVFEFTVGQYLAGMEISEEYTSETTFVVDLAEAQECVTPA